MNRIISRLGIALFGFIALGMLSPAHAWERPPVKVNTVFQFDIEVKVGPDPSRPTMPWYLYFPADARMTPPMQMTPFPPFPQRYPPQPGALPAPQKLLRFSNMQPGPQMTQMWPTYNTGLQPVGYVPVQAPSYWYNAR